MWTPALGWRSAFPLDGSSLQGYHVRVRTVRKANRTARLDMRMEPWQKELLEQAAAFLGQDVTSFAMSTLLARAHDIVDRTRMTLLSQKAFKSLQRLLEKDSPSIPALRAAIMRLKTVNDELREQTGAERVYQRGKQ